MANWLEAEEQKKRLLLEREESVHTGLERFYGVCSRVNSVRPGSLEINRLTITGTPSYTISKMQDDGDGGRTGTFGSRGLRFDCSHQDHFLLDILTIEHHRGFDRVAGDMTYDKEKLLARKKFAFQHLAEWSDDQMLSAVQWILLDSDAIEECTPGTTVITEQAPGKSAVVAPTATGELVIVRSKALTGSMYAVQVTIDGRLMGEVKNGATIKLAIPGGRHEVKVNGGGLSRSATIEVAAGQSVHYQMSFSNWGALGGGLKFGPA